MKKRTFSNNQIMAGLFVCFLIAAIIIIVSAKRKSDTPEEVESTTPVVNEDAGKPESVPATPITTTRSFLPKPKIKLSDIVGEDKSWMPNLPLYDGKAAPALTLTDLNGTQHSLQQYRGKPVLLLIWTPKGSSVSQLQELKELQESGEAPDLQILGLCFESSTPIVNNETIRQFSQTHPDLTFPLCVASLDAVPGPYNLIGSVPCSFFITPEGHIKITATGFVPQADIKSILKADE